MSAPHRSQVDFARFAALGPDERFSQKLLSRADGSDNVTISYIRTPPGGGSPEGLHKHEVDQVFYIVEGSMEIEIDGDRFAADRGSVVVFPAGVPHQNWNATDADVIHLNICGPAPDPNRPFVIPAES